MYKLAENGQMIVHENDTGAKFFAFDMLNPDYVELLDNINKNGNEVFDGELPEKLVTDAAQRSLSLAVEEFVKANSRLSRYILSEGKPEQKVMVPTGEMTFNQETLEYEDVLVEATEPAIEPLVEFINEITKNEEGELVTTQVRNPLIIQDETERAAAQAIVDATPQEVKDAA